MTKTSFVWAVVIAIVLCVVSAMPFLFMTTVAKVGGGAILFDYEVALGCEYKICGMRAAQWPIDTAYITNSNAPIDVIVPSGRDVVTSRILGSPGIDGLLYADNKVFVRYTDRDDQQSVLVQSFYVLDKSRCTLNRIDENDLDELRQAEAVHSWIAPWQSPDMIVIPRDE